MDNFFKHYPLISYGNTVSSSAAVNILAKIAFQKKLQQQYEIFHPYTIQEGDRADTISYLYYGDPGYDWLVYFSNDIIDPYYDWYMDTDSFKRFITKKYGSIEISQRKIKFFRSNYTQDDSVITTAAYGALSGIEKKFWTPIVGINNSAISYERKKEDIIYQTNQVKQLDVSLLSEAQFVAGEYVIQLSGGLTVATATASYCNTSTIILENVIGSLSTSLNLKGGESGANATVNSISSLSSPISESIQSYFSPVSFYDYETEQNEKKKNIKLIDVSYLSAIENEFKTLLSS